MSESLLFNVSLSVYIHFVHPLIRGHLGCSHLAVVNRAAANMGVHVSESSQLFFIPKSDPVT